jgi:hypothetical protein
MSALTRLILFLSVPLSLVFTAAVLLIHAQPYDDPDLRAVITLSDKCHTPCFLDIQPGVTTIDEAISILQNHQWVKTVMAMAPDRLATQHIYWEWRDDAPAFIQSGKPHSGGSLFVNYGIVQNVEVSTGIPLGTVWLWRGAPEQFTTLAQTGGPIGRPPPPRPLTYIYNDMILIGSTDCTAFSYFWKSNLKIIFGDPAAWLKTVIPYPPLPGTTSVTRFVYDVKRHFCP